MCTPFSPMKSLIKSRTTALPTSFGSTDRSLRIAAHAIPRSLLIASALLVTALFANSARAVVISINSTLYDVQFIVGSYNDNIATLMDQPWWNSPSTAQAAALAVGPHL